ncbi:MAG TPA: carboxylesterase family protein [Streptosporangiaceae bacterium]
MSTIAVASTALAGGAGTAGAGTAGAGVNGAGQPIVRTSSGFVRGLATSTGIEFRGIPYAAPPVGALRWRPPQPVARWSGVRDATRFGSPCAQNASAFGVASTSEDCLFLNVYAPPGPVKGPKRPVMVWIHGGSLNVGNGDGYDPSNLARRGVVVVTINYRLGALGWLAHPALRDADGAAGNYGFMDQQAALRWVRRNIGGFGGAPRDVTIFGESAGGLSVLSHLISPASRGLFTKGIVESGDYAPTLAPQRTAETAGEAFAASAGCADQTAACLRSLPVSTILAEESHGVGGYQTIIDGKEITQSIQPALDKGEFTRVPVMVGSNHDEWRLIVAIEELLGAPVTADNYQSRIQSDLRVSPSAAAAIAARYPLSAYPSAALAMGAAGTDAVYACTANAAARSLSRYVPTFAYEFNDENAPQMFLPPVSFPYGAAHASELPYLFAHLLGKSADLSAPQRQLADTMQRYWTGFAGRGFPSSPGGPTWPRFTRAAPTVQSLIPPRPHGETGFAAAHQCAFWRTIR